MARSSIPLIMLALFAGLAGGAIAQIAFRGDAPLPAAAPSREAAEDSDLREQVARLERILDEKALEVADLAGRLASVERAEEEARVARQGLSGAAGGPPGTPAARGMRFVPGGQVGGARVAPGTVQLGGMGGLGKMGELMAMSEEERWDKAREDLSLDSYQESEMRRIAEEMQTEMRGMLKLDPETGRPSGSLDIGKMMEGRRKADERVKNLLSKDQYNKYRSNGYSALLGTGGSAVAWSFSSSREPEDK